MIHPRAVWRPYAVVRKGPGRYQILWAEMLNAGGTLVYSFSGLGEYGRKSDAISEARHRNDRYEASLKAEQIRSAAVEHHR